MQLTNNHNQRTFELERLLDESMKLDRAKELSVLSSNPKVFRQAKVNGYSIYYRATPC